MNILLATVINPTTFNRFLIREPTDDFRKMHMLAQVSFFRDLPLHVMADHPKRENPEGPLSMSEFTK